MTQLPTLLYDSTTHTAVWLNYPHCCMTQLPTLLYCMDFRYCRVCWPMWVPCHCSSSCSQVKSRGSSLAPLYFSNHGNQVSWPNLRWSDPCRKMLFCTQDGSECVPVIMFTLYIVQCGVYIGLCMGLNNLCCVTCHFLLLFSVSHAMSYKNFTSSRRFLYIFIYVFIIL